MSMKDGACGQSSVLNSYVNNAGCSGCYVDGKFVVLMSKQVVIVLYGWKDSVRQLSMEDAVIARR